MTFRLADADRALTEVHLVDEIGLPPERRRFSRVRQQWRLRLARPLVDRMEYRLSVRHARAGWEEVLDPANPRTAPGAFGPKSVIEFPGYRPPAWLDAEVPLGSSRPLGRAGRVWTPEGLEDAEPALLLVVHDGPEYDELAGLTRFLGAAIASGSIPPVRALLLAPGPDRDRAYGANPAHARTLHATVLPAVEAAMATTARIGMGTSLGALAMLHVHVHHPGRFAGLFLQSGSFFTRELDPQERRFSRFGPVARFVAVAERVASAPVPVGMTCGVAEENLANNRRMAAVLAAHGSQVHLAETADAHNYTAWRDAFEPHLRELIAHAT